jgi:hypothetical protein
MKKVHDVGIKERRRHSCSSPMLDPVAGTSLAPPHQSALALADTCAARLPGGEEGAHGTD